MTWLRHRTSRVPHHHQLGGAHPRALIPPPPIDNNEAEAAIQRLAEHVIEHGLHAPVRTVPRWSGNRSRLRQLLHDQRHDLAGAGLAQECGSDRHRPSRAVGVVD